MTAPRVLAVRNSPTSGIGRLLSWLEEEGLSVTETDGVDAPDSPEGYDAVILLGGGFLPDDDIHHPWLPRERRLARRAVQDETPLLGICLGGQLLAAAHAGTVKGDFGTPERGSCSVTLLPDAADDRLLRGLHASFPVIQNHRDQITDLPEGAVHLAGSEACPVQAFRLGAQAWGLQFHPEAGADRLARWDEAALTEEGLDLQPLRAEAERAEPDAARAARKLIANFAAVVREHAATEPMVLDGHNDLPWAYRVHRDSSVADFTGPAPAFHTDLPRLRAGRVGAQFWVAYVDCKDPAPVRSTLQQIDLVHRLIAAHPDDLRLAWNATDVRQTMRQGRIASLLGVEGGHSIGDDLAVLRSFARLGVRYMTLTHTSNTPWADSATDTALNDGLSDRGREIVREMQRLGILVDLSHVSAATMHDALDVAEAPVIFSHSSCAAVNPHPRNVPDDVLARTAAGGGVLMLTFVPSFVSAEHWAWSRLPEAERDEADRPVVTVGQVADHVEHAREVAGIAHIGLGGDYDGTPVLPPQLADVAGYPALFDELRARHWAPAELRALASGNILRVLADTDDAFEANRHRAD
ncbi:membrane dipeptidase [Streptomyces rochei]|uniref:membrane dipeptidase n=1 Tax=Streptomyces rochei TaxID=1928 RepID=UPI0033D6A975